MVTVKKWFTSKTIGAAAVTFLLGGYNALAVEKGWPHMSVEQLGTWMATLSVIIGIFRGNATAKLVK